MRIERNDESGDRQRGGIVTAMRRRGVCMPDRGLPVLLAQTAAREEMMMAPRQRRMGRRVGRIDRKRLFQKRDGAVSVVGLADIDQRQRPQHQIIGVEAVSALALDPLDLGASQAGLDGADHADRDLILHGEDVIERTVIALGPQMRAALGLDQLGGDADAIACLAHAAFQHVTDAEIAPDLLHVDRPAPVGGARIARDHEQPADA